MSDIGLDIRPIATKAVLALRRLFAITYTKVTITAKWTAIKVFIVW